MNEAGKLRIAIVGSTGYGGVELIRLLQNHPLVAITSVISSSTAGVPLSDGFPHLTEIITEHLDGIEIDTIKSKADLVFTATPSGISTGLVPKLLAAGLKVVDLSGDFRLKSPAEYEQWYKHPAPEQAYLDQAVFGLCELYGDVVRGVDFVSNPGCYPTATTLGLIPLFRADWIDADSIIVDAKSGVSGAGRGLSLNIHYAEINENFKAYKINKHQHIPEIEQVLSDVAQTPVRITFTTHLVPMTRGIMCTIYVKLRESVSEQQVIDLYREFYKGRKFVRIRDVGKWPATKEVAGSNYCDIGFSIDARTGRMTIVSVIDNLVKGAAGQAIQNMNLMMGWEETTGLLFAPVYP
jgi:N-acetyl-gamma-glutamyl-phosphate reductase